MAAKESVLKSDGTAQQRAEGRGGREGGTPNGVAFCGIPQRANRPAHHLLAQSAFCMELPGGPRTTMPAEIGFYDAPPVSDLVAKDRAKRAEENMVSLYLVYPL